MAGILNLLGRAVDDLVKMGYPESVAKRISSGELPMDFESRIARAREQGYDVTPEYRGGGLTQIEDPEALFDNGFFSSQNPYVASTYAMKPDVGNVMPVLIRKEGYLPVDAGGADWNEIQVQNMSPLQDMLLERGYRGAGQIDTDQILNIASESGRSGVTYKDVRDIGPYIRGLDKKFLSRADGGSNNTASVDPSTVRSLLSAAFDPEYTGPNILGSRMAPTAGAGLLGILGLTEKDLEDLK